MANWYIPWVSHHVAAFGIADEKTANAFVAWEEAITVSLAADEVEMYEVTRRALLDTPTPRWPNDHLDAIKRHLAQIKAKSKAEAERHDADEYGTCDLCSNTGFVIVPHPRHVKLGVWEPHRFTAAGDPIRATAGVYCTTCRYGEKLFGNACRNAADKGRDPPLDIRGYEQKVGKHWRDLVAEENERRGILARAREIGEAVRAGDIVGNLAKLYRKG